MKLLSRILPMMAKEYCHMNKENALKKEYILNRKTPMQGSDMKNPYPSGQTHFCPTTRWNIKFMIKQFKLLI